MAYKKDVIIKLLDSKCLNIFGCTIDDATEKQAYRYIRLYNGIAFIEQNYGIIHTLDFNEAVDSVTLFCRRKGGKL